MARLILFVIAICMIGNTYCAPRTGYMITHQSDTTWGRFPGYKQWIVNPAYVAFISSSGDSMRLTPFNCRLFHIDGYETYTAFRGTRMTNPVTYATASADDNTDAYDTITVFLRKIATMEPYAFYVLEDKRRINLYYSTDGLSFTELKQKASFVDNRFWESATYKQQLKALLPEKAAAIEDMMYAAESIIRLARTANNTRQAAPRLNKNNGLVVSAGVSLNRLSFTGANSYRFSNRNYPDAMVPIVAAGYLLSVNRNFSRLFILPTVKISSFKHHSAAGVNGDYPVFTNTFQSSPVVTLNLNLGYNLLNNPKLKLSVAPGVGLHFMPGNKQIDESKYSETNITRVVTQMDHATPLANLQIMGIINNKLLAWATYNFPAAVITYEATSGRIASLQFAVGYKF